MDIRDAALDLINFNKQRGVWNYGLNDSKTADFISVLIKDKSFFQIMDVDLVEDFLGNIFIDLELPDKKRITSRDADAFIKQLKRNLELNVKDYFILIPILGADLTNTLDVTNDISFIAGSRDVKIKEIARLTGLDAEYINENLSHTERSRSKYFLNHPLILFRVKHQFRTVSINAEYLTFYLINFIKLIYRSYVYPDYRKKGILGNFRTIEEDYRDRYENNNEHVVILGESNWGHSPIWFKHDFNYNLDWLKDSTYSNLLLSLINTIDLKSFQTEINSMFLRAIRFFNRSLDARSRSRFYDIEADVILMLTIAAETVLLESQEERNKQRKVVGRLTRLANYNDLNYSQNQIKELIRQMYRVRSGYVHEGMYHGPFEISSPENDIETYRKLIGRILCDANKHITHTLRESEQLNSPIKEVWINIISNNIEDSSS